jgi:hypothetical protein
MNNSRDILIQILGIMGSSEGTASPRVDHFLNLIEVRALTDLIQSLPVEKHNQIIDQWIATPDTPQKAENILGAYYTRDQMNQSLKNATKKAIVKYLVEPHSEQLAPIQRDNIFALLEKLTC